MSSCALVFALEYFKPVTSVTFWHQDKRGNTDDTKPDIPSYACVFFCRHTSESCEGTWKCHVVHATRQMKKRAFLCIVNLLLLAACSSLNSAKKNRNQCQDWFLCCASSFEMVLDWRNKVFCPSCTNQDIITSWSTVLNINGGGSRDNEIIHIWVYQSWMKGLHLL